MSGFISKETIDKVNKQDIVSIISEYTKLSPKGDTYWGCCPFHHEKTASFSVNPREGLYYCFGCHAGGNLIKFAMEMEKTSFPETVESLCKRFNIEIQYEEGAVKTEDPKFKLISEYINLYDRVTSLFHYILLNLPQGKNALSYITGRGITVDTIRKFKLGYAPGDRTWLKHFLLKKNFSEDFLRGSGLFSSKYPDYAFFSNRLMFPIFNKQGQAVAMGGRKLDENPNSPKYLNSGDLVQYKKGETLFAFNFAKNSIRENKKVIFCEGYMDCIAYHQCGIEYAVAPLGTALTEDQIKIIKPFVDEVLLSFDSDGAGQKATERAIIMLRKQNIPTRVIKLNGGKDPAEIMINQGVQALTSAISNAILDSEFLLSKLRLEYPVDTPDGKVKAAFHFFEYIDALQTDIEKNECKEKLASTFNMRLEDVNGDFEHRVEAQKRLNMRVEAASNSEPKVVVNAGIRCVLALLADISSYESYRIQYNSAYFSDAYARELLSVIESCYKDGVLCSSEVMNRINNPSLRGIVGSSLVTGEFRNNAELSIKGCLKSIEIQKLTLEKKQISEKLLELCSRGDSQDAIMSLIDRQAELAKQLTNI